MAISRSPASDRHGEVELDGQLLSLFEGEPAREREVGTYTEMKWSFRHAEIRVKYHKTSCEQWTTCFGLSIETNLR